LTRITKSCAGPKSFKTNLFSTPPLAIILGRIAQALVKNKLKRNEKELNAILLASAAGKKKPTKRNLSRQPILEPLREDQRPIRRQDSFSKPSRISNKWPSGICKGKEIPTDGAFRPVPAYIRNRLQAEQKAGAFFSTLPPWHRRMCVSWVDSAKKEETKQRQLAELIATLRAKRKLGMK
jgi:hypothetical protein